jgi:hypothetical protein
MDYQDVLSEHALTNWQVSSLTFVSSHNRSTDDAISIALHTVLSYLDKRNTYVRRLFIDYNIQHHSALKSHHLAQDPGTKHLPLQLDPVRTAQCITGAKLPAIQDLYTRQCQRKALKIIDSSHPSHRLFSLLFARQAVRLGPKDFLTASTTKP